MIICHLRDHEIREENNVLLPNTSAFGEFVRHAVFLHENVPIDVASPALCAYDKEQNHQSNRVFIIHRDLANDGIWANAFANKLNGHAVIVSTQRVFNVPADWPDERTHACEWTPSEFANPPTRLAKWLGQVTAGDIEVIDWDLLRRDRVEPILAFRLLCEAWKIKKIDRKENCEGITIHAPEKLEQWLAPFGIKFGDINKNELVVEAIEQVAGMIGSGDIKTMAKAVLETADSKGKDLEKVILDFLAEVAKPTA
jgi:hypothetical protein